MDYERALSSAWGIASSLTAIKRYYDVEADELRNALWGVANLIEAAQEDIGAHLQSSIEEAAQALAAERAARPPEKATRAAK